MAVNASHFGIIISAKDNASGALNRIAGRFTAMGGAATAANSKIMTGMKMLAGGLALAVVGAVGVGGALKAAGAAGRFEQGIARVGAISRATTEDLGKLEDAARRAGIETQFSPEEAVEGLTALSAVGFNATEAISVLNPALDLAAGGMIGVEEASSSVSSALKVFAIDVSEAGSVTDRLLRITNLTALQAVDLKLALGTVARGAVAAKQKLSEMLPAMGLVKNTGVDASVAASSVSSALIFMAKNAKRFKEIGVSVTDADGKFRPFMDIVLDSSKALDKYGNEAERAAMVTKLFGRFGATAFAGVSAQLNAGIKNAEGQVVKGAEAIQFLRQQMDDSTGAAEEFKKTLLDTFQGQKTLLKGSAQTFLIEFGKPFAQVLKPVLAGIIGFLNNAINVMNKIPGPVKNIFAGLLVGVSVLSLLVGVLVLVKAVLFLGVIPGLWGMATAAIGAAAASIAAFWPFYLVALLVLGAIIAVFKLLGKTPPKLKPTIETPSFGGAAPLKVKAAIGPGGSLPDTFEAPGAAAGRGATGAAERRQKQQLAARERPLQVQNEVTVNLDGKKVGKSLDRDRRDTAKRKNRSLG